MSKTLILLISIFSVWAFVSFSKSVQQDNKDRGDISNFADDGVMRTNTNNRFIINEVRV